MFYSVYNLPGVLFLMSIHKLLYSCRCHKSGAGFIKSGAKLNIKCEMLQGLKEFRMTVFYSTFI